jgi:hypothetical protein
MKLPVSALPFRAPLVLLVALFTLPACSTFVHYGSETELGFGARAHIPMESLISEDEEGTRTISRFEFAPSIYRGSPQGANWTEANADFLLPLFRLVEGQARAYAGAGVGVGRLSVDEVGSTTEVGANIIGGVRFERRTFAPFAEARGSVGGTGQLGVVVGVQLFGGGF